MLAPLVSLAEHGAFPDPLLRMGIRRLVAARKRELVQGIGRVGADALAHRALAIHTDRANEQHYEVPAELFEAALGPRLKYSSCYYPDAGTTLAEAEEAMLALTCEHADLADGQDVLELGCGWGSLTLWMAARYPRSRITAMSNSHSQREYILSRARSQGLTNVEILTCDFNDFDAEGQFDRVMSVEMFEHLQNWDTAFERVARWLKPEGRAFLHVFCHRTHAYLFEGQNNWMASHFFTGGLMPAFDLPHAFGQHLAVEADWWIPGSHYERTSNDWLAEFDASTPALRSVLSDTYGEDASRWLHRWRLFFLAVAEMFGYDEGAEWGVGHYRLKRGG